MQKYVVEWGREKYYDTYTRLFPFEFGVYVELSCFSCRVPILWSSVPSIAAATLLYGSTLPYGYVTQRFATPEYTE